MKSSFTLYSAFIVAVVATLGSLYLSEIKGFIPCELCWYQRICMYPLSLILGIATFNDDKSIKKYVLPIAIVGGCISIYHYLEQKVPGFADIMPCTKGVPCNIDYLDWWGVITIPFMALVAFILIILLMLVTPTNKSSE